MSQQAAQLMMVGSEGKRDYLVVVKFGSAAIGVKPVIEELAYQEKGPQVLIGVRVRLAAAPGVTLLNAEHVANTLCSAIPWQKKAVDRCSVFLGSMVPPFPSFMTPETFISTLKDTGFFDKILQYLQPVYELDVNILSTMVDVSDFLQSQYAVMAESHLKKAVPSGNGGKVVPFKLCCR